MAEFLLRVTNLILLTLVSLAAHAGPLANPGDMRLRHDLELLNDAGIINVPLTAWPVSLPDIRAELEVLPPSSSIELAQAYRRVSARLNSELDVRMPRFGVSLSGAVEPRFVRSFQDTPRDEGELAATLDWFGQRFAARQGPQPDCGIFRAVG